MTPEQLCELTYTYSLQEKNSVDEVSDVMGGIMDWLFEGNLEALVRFYEILDIKRMNLMYLAGVIRAAFGHGEQISTWGDFRLRAIEEAKERYPDDMKDAFYGLLELDTYKSGLEGSFDRLIGIHPTLVRD